MFISLQYGNFNVPLHENMGFCAFIHIPNATKARIREIVTSS